MTRHANLRKCLGGSPAGLRIARLCTLTLAATLLTGGAAAGFGQDKPDATKPAKQVTETKPAAAPADKVVNGYTVHQSLEVGGRVTHEAGSQAMWDTLFNQTSGERILGQTLEMRTVNPAKTPFFDTLTTSSTGYGGDPIDVTRLNLSKGRIYDFSGSFRRDRNYFDYNLLDNSLLTTFTATAPPLTAEPDSLHMFNTVRRNSDMNLTLMPLSKVSLRFAYNHGTHEGPTYSTIHNAGDVQLLNWFRNSSDTYNGGFDWKMAPRTTLSYDQFVVMYRGDTTFQMAPTGLTLSNGTPVSLGVEVLAGTTTCGSATAKPVSTLGPEVTGTIINPYCTGTLAQNLTEPIRTKFPTEQFRFSSHYWDKFSINARLLYTADKTNITNFNEFFNGLTSNRRQTLVTGNGQNNLYGINKRDNVSGDLGIIGELSKYVSLSEAFTIFSTRNDGFFNANTETWTGSAGSAAGTGGTPPAVPTTSMLTPLSDPSITITNASSTGTSFLDQKVAQNTVMVTATVIPQIKLSGGWRFKVRTINDPHATNLTWNENTGLVGAVIQPSRAFRFNFNYETMNSAYSSGTAILGEATGTPALYSSNTFTRIAPNTSYHLRARTTILPAKWLTLAITGNDYKGQNNDPMTNHVEENQDISFAAIITPNDQLSMEFNYAYDDVNASTNLCYIFTTNVNFPNPPAGAANTGTCLKTTANPEGATNLNLGYGTFDSPSNFFSTSVNYSPWRDLKLNAGTRLNNVNGTAEQLNPLMIPGALQSLYLIPFADVQYNVTPQWTWHGNFVYDGYSEGGPQVNYPAASTGQALPAVSILPRRNVHGNVLTLSVKYAF